MILETFKKHPARPSVLESFEYMDRREDQLRSQRDNNPDFEKYFEECCEYYKNNPDDFPPLKKNYYNKKSSKKSSSNPYNNYKGNYQSNKPAQFKKQESPKKIWKVETKSPVNLEEQFFVKTQGKVSKKLRDVKSQTGQINGSEQNGHENGHHHEENGNGNGNYKLVPNGKMNNNGAVEKHS